MLEQFYAITVSRSLYLAYIGVEGVKPFLQKIQGDGRRTFPLGKKINNGDLIAIGRRLYLFSPEDGKREIAKVHINYCGGNTSDVVALFLKQEDAQTCLRHLDLTACDLRWERQTIEVLKKIGLDHPRCSISTDVGMGLMCPSKWK